jgi:hypothetical protein
MSCPGNKNTPSGFWTQTWLVPVASQTLHPPSGTSGQPEGLLGAGITGAGVSTLGGRVTPGGRVTAGDSVVGGVGRSVGGGMVTTCVGTGVGYHEE